MFEILPSGDDVIAIRISGSLDEDELNAMTERVEGALEDRAKVHMFVEIDALTGFPWSALPAYLPRAAAMLVKLRRFGRIAVVADQTWIRWLTRLESMILPGISYEIFHADERTRAMDWAEGREVRPHPAAIRFIDTDAEDVIAFDLNGRIGADEMESVIARFDQAFAAGRPLRVLGRIGHLDGVEPGAVLDLGYVRMKLEALRRVERYALVGGPAWIRSWVALWAPLVRLELRHYEVEDEAQAWAWISARPRSETGAKAAA